MEMPELSMSSKLIIGVTGGIAAFKTASLVSALVQDGHTVTVVMTRAAQELVGPATFSALTGRPVATDLFDRRYPLGAHIEQVGNADLFCVVPASANIMAKAACGLADDLLSTMLLSFTGTVLFAPAMNTAMWEKPSVQRNVKRLREDGCHFVDPQEGWLSCRSTGIGRMAEPADIQAAIDRLLRPR
jgi:phosphopantothenoylcysteine decarboxylase/phosphopantothenate--cysteine ligase